MVEQARVDIARDYPRVWNPFGHLESTHGLHSGEVFLDACATEVGAQAFFEVAQSLEPLVSRILVGGRLPN